MSAVSAAASMFKAGAQRLHFSCATQILSLTGNECHRPLTTGVFTPPSQAQASASPVTTPSRLLQRRQVRRIYKCRERNLCPDVFQKLVHDRQGLADGDVHIEVPIRPQPA